MTVIIELLINGANINNVSRLLARLLIRWADYHLDVAVDHLTVGKKKERSDRKTQEHRTKM